MGDAPQGLVPGFAPPIVEVFGDRLPFQACAFQGVNGHCRTVRATVIGMALELVVPAQVIQIRRFNIRHGVPSPLFYKPSGLKSKPGCVKIAFMPNRIYYADNLSVLKSMESASVDLIYIDPPFNTGKTQARTQIQTVQSDNGDRKGFGGQRYQTIKVGSKGYIDIFDDFSGFLEPRLVEAYRILKPQGSLYFHIDYREVHYCKILLDQIFGRDSFLNEIIWAYDYGARTRKKWPAKHDNILWYVKDPENYTYNVDDIERIPYMAPGLVGQEKAAKGKLPTDTWWHTIVPTNGHEKTGYPTQKPLGVINRIVRASSNPGEVVMDFFAGSGTVGQSCLDLGRLFVLIDNNPEAIEVMHKRFDGRADIEWINTLV